MRCKFSLDYKKLRYAVCVYIALPLLLFLIGFLKWYYTLTGLTALAVAVWHVLRSDNVQPGHDESVGMSIPGLTCVFLAMLLWTYLGGHNGYFYQSTDWNCRNAIFHDLILYRWPVVYESTGAALVYYVGQWLPPAAVGKLILRLTGSFDSAWLWGKMALWIWNSAGLTIVALLIFRFLNTASRKKKAVALLVFVFFSGMDIVGALLMGNAAQLLTPDTLHMEWWSGFQFSSMTTCVFWVFNQTIVPWVITLCFMLEDSPENYVLYGIACLLCGPFPCVGLAICMGVKAGCYIIRRARRGEWRAAVRKVLSGTNLVAFIGVFPFVAAYILANNAISAVGDDGIALVQSSFFSREYWTRELLLFLLLEAGCYMLLVLPVHKRDPLYYALALTFVICPYFHIGEGQDFCMRVSIPAILILMLYSVQFLFCYIAQKPAAGCSGLRRACARMLAVCLALGAVTPLVEVYRGFYHVMTEGTLRLEDMRITSFDNGQVYLNFNASNPDEQVFFKYFSR